MPLLSTLAVRLSPEYWIDPANTSTKPASVTFCANVVDASKPETAAATKVFFITKPLNDCHKS